MIRIQYDSIGCVRWTSKTSQDHSLRAICRVADRLGPTSPGSVFLLWLKQRDKGQRPEASNKHYLETLVAMQFFRAFAVICLAWTAPLFLQGCSSDSDDLVTSNDDNTTATVTVTATATATVTSTATATVTTTVTVA